MTSPKAARALVVASGLVCSLGLAVELVHGQSHAGWVEESVALLSLSYEQNLPTWYSSLLLAAAALLCAAISAAAARDRGHWRALTGLFTLMSFDEVAELHERLGGLVGTGGVLYFDWVIPATVALLLFAAFFVRFWIRLPSPLRSRMAWAGVLYVGGALLMELPLGYWTERAGTDNLGYALIDWVEESLEIAGASVLVLALWHHTHRDAP